MDCFERRWRILLFLCRRRHDTAANLAMEFGVSKRTISRDIDELSHVAPIYTEAGNGGGIRVQENYMMDRMYMREDELAVLNHAIKQADEGAKINLTADEMRIFRLIIHTYTKPSVEKAKKPPDLT